MGDERIEWRIDAANFRVVRWALYGWIGLLGGGALLAGGGLVAVAVGAARGGNVGVLAVAVLLVLVGGPASVLYLWPALRDPEAHLPLSMFLPDPVDDPAEPLAERYAAAFTPGRVLGAAVAGAISLVALFAVDERVAYAVAALAFVAWPLVAGFVAWGRIDPAEPTFEYGAGTVPLEAVEGVRRLRLGDVVVCWVSYRSGARTVSTPTLLAFTPDAYGAFERALENADRDVAESRPRNPAITAAAVAIGLVFLAVAVGVWLVGGVEAAYFSAILGLLGVVFCWAGLTLT